MPRLDPQSLPQHVDRLYRAAWALCGSPHDAEDLVQETFMRVLARPRFLHGQDELAYLMRVLRNTFLSQRRTAARRPRTGTTTLEDIEAIDTRTGERPEEALQAQEVLTTIAELSENHRLALVAVDVIGLSYREAANALGTREATIATRVFRAREQVALGLERGQRPAAAQAPTASGRQTRPVSARDAAPPVRPADDLRAAQSAGGSRQLRPIDGARRGKVMDSGGVFSSEVSHDS